MEFSSLFGGNQQQLPLFFVDILAGPKVGFAQGDSE
jgi:hypothetical protein